MIRVLVADDSATARAMITATLNSEPDIRVVGEAVTGQDAVDKAATLLPDLITMDVHMPGMDGIEATRQVMVHSPRPIIIVSASARESEVAFSLEATRAGALMVLPKPHGPSDPAFASDSAQLVSMVRAMSEVKVVRRHGVGSSPRAPGFSTPSAATPIASRPRLIAIAASTGGPVAIRTILSALPKKFPVPVLCVQHIARGFSSGLAHWLGDDTDLDVCLGQHGHVARAGKVYFAPEDHHIGCRLDANGSIRIVTDASPPIGAFRPSANYLFRSCAEALGSTLVSVILTGMGDDGVEGLRVAKRAGGRVIAQDESTSVVFGMPREAQRAGIVDEVLRVESIARRLAELVEP